MIDTIKKILNKIHDNIVWAIRCKELFVCVGYDESPLRDGVVRAINFQPPVLGYNACTRCLYSDLIMTICRIYDQPLNGTTACLELLFELLKEPAVLQELQKSGLNTERIIGGAYSKYIIIRGNHRLSRLKDHARNGLFAHSALDVESRPKSKTGYAEDILDETILIVEQLREVYKYFGLYDDDVNDYGRLQRRHKDEAETFWKQFIK